MWRQEHGVMEMFLAYYDQYVHSQRNRKTYREFLFEILIHHEDTHHAPNNGIGETSALRRMKYSLSAYDTMLLRENGITGTTSSSVSSQPRETKITGHFEENVECPRDSTTNGTSHGFGTLESAVQSLCNVKIEADEAEAGTADCPDDLQDFGNEELRHIQLIEKMCINQTSKYFVNSGSGRDWSGDISANSEDDVGKDFGEIVSENSAATVHAVKIENSIEGSGSAPFRLRGGPSYASGVTDEDFQRISNLPPNHFTKPDSIHAMVQGVSDSPARTAVTAQPSSDISKAHRVQCRPSSNSSDFRCQYCSKTFPRRYNLTLHERTHTGDRPYRCSVCSKRFLQRSHLVTHVKIHTGANSYCCSHCPVTFRRLQALQQHELMHDFVKQCEMTAVPSENASVSQ